MTDIIVVTSGGMDSTTALYLARHRYPDKSIETLSFDYGQRHKKELQCARELSQHLGIKHQIVDLAGVATLLAGASALTGGEEVPEGHYAEDNMAKTVVPNRNSIMANVAAAYAIAQEARMLVLGVHAGDHAVYPDCRPPFVFALQNLLMTANEGFIRLDFEVATPFLYASKADIAKAGLALGVPYARTWTCYKGGEIACGKCGTCVERLEAFAENGAEDPLEYEDREYWKTVVKP